MGDTRPLHNAECPHPEVSKQLVMIDASAGVGGVGGGIKLHALCSILYSYGTRLLFNGSVTCRERGRPPIAHGAPLCSLFNDYQSRARSGHGSRQPRTACRVGQSATGPGAAV